MSLKKNFKRHKELVLSLSSNEVVKSQGATRESLEQGMKKAQQEAEKYYEQVSALIVDKSRLNCFQRGKQVNSRISNLANYVRKWNC